MKRFFTAFTLAFFSFVIAQAAAPVVSSVTFPAGGYKIGSIIVVAIAADGTGYTVDAGTTINGVDVTGTFASAGGNNYTLTYTVGSGDPDRASVGAIPINILIRSAAGAGNLNTYTTAPTSGGTVTIDANAPVISSVTSNATGAGVLKIGQTIIFTADIQTTEAGLTLAPTSYNGGALTWSTSNGGDTYTATYTVASGQTDQTSALQLTNVTATDAATNTSGAVSGSDVVKTIDANAPVILSVTSDATGAGVLKIGQTIVFTADIQTTEAGLTLAPITYNGGALTWSTSNGGDTYTATYTVASGQTDRTSAFQLTNVTATDAAGNTSGAVSGADVVKTIDANAPSFTLASNAGSAGVLKIGQTIVFTATMSVAETGLVFAPTTYNGRTFAPSWATADAGAHYTATYTVTSGDPDQTSALQLTGVTATDVAGNTSGSVSTVNVVKTIDANAPVITSVTSNATGAGALKIGQTIIFTATMSIAESGLVFAPTTYNGRTFVPSWATADAGAHYTATYTVTSGDPDQTSALQLTNVTATDAAGNASGAVSGSDVAKTIDAHKPSVTVNQSVGQADPTNVSPISFTIVFSEAIDPTTFVNGDITLGGTAAGKSVNTLGTTDNITWTLTVNATGGGTVIPSIAVATVQDPAGNDNTVSTSTDNTVTFDNTPPTALTTGALTTTGGTVVATYWNLTNTGLNVVVPLTATDATLDNGTVQIQIQNTTTNTWVNVGGVLDAAGSGLTTTTPPQRTGGTKTVSISAANLEGTSGFIEGLAGGPSTAESQFVQVRAVVTDHAGNSTNWNKNATNIDVDQTAPSVTGASFSASFTASSDPSFTTCNGTAIGASPGGDSNREMVHLTISEPLNLANGAAIPTGGTGFTASTGTGFSTCSNRGGTAYHPTNIIHLKSNNDGDWTSATTYSFTAGGTVVKDAAGNEMGTFSGLNPADTDPPELATGLVFNANGSSPETITFKFDGPLNAAVTNTVTGFTTSVGTIAGGANYNSGTQTVTFTSTADGAWTDAVTLSYSQATGNVTDAANNELVAFGGAAPAPAEPIFLTSVHILSNNGTNTAFATTGNTITLTFNVARALASTPVVTFYGATPATTVTGPVGSTYTATLLMTGAMAETIVPLQIDVAESIKSTTATATTDSPTGSTVTFDKTAPTVTPVTIASNNTNPVYAKVGDVVTVSYTATDNLGTVSVSPATIDGLAASTITATAATLTTTASDNNGVMPFSITFKDQAGNSSVKTATTNASAVTFDKAPPVVASIATSSTLKGIGTTNGIIACPSCGNTSVKFLVTFTEANTPLAGIDATDFTVSATGTVTYSSPVVVAVTSATTRTVTINGINGYGKISLGVTDDNTILDAASNPLAGAADGSVAPAFTGSQYYTIVLPEPTNEAFVLTPSNITANSVTLTWNSTNTAQIPTNFLVLARPSTGPAYPAVTDGTPISNGALAQNVARVLGTNTYIFTGLNSGTSYDFIVYKYTLESNNSSDNTDYEITSAASTNGVITNSASLTTFGLNSTPVPISSIKNASGNSVDVMQFTVYDDGQDAISPNVMTLHLNGSSQESITFTLRDQLTLAEGANVTGFTSSTGAVASAVYSGKGTTNTITLTSASNGTWSSATTISYSPAPGNAQFVTLGTMLAIDSHVVAQATDITSTFLTNGTFIVPAGVTQIQVEAWGAGGSGGTYSSDYGAGSGGGGGGAYSRSLLTVTPGASLNYVVGTGAPALPNDASCCTVANPGGASSFNGQVIADGGESGESSAYFAFYGANYIGNFSTGHFGLGGSTANSIGDVRFSGGNGGHGGSLFATSSGTGPFPMLLYAPGGGGSSAGASANGNSGGSGPIAICPGCGVGGGAAPAFGGPGGPGFQSSNGSGGGSPGGGGGGTGAALISGAGANGQIKITYSSPVGGGTSDWTADNSPTKFSQLVIGQGASNDAAFSDWRNIIAGAELFDGTNTVTGVINPTDGSNITFTTILSPTPTAATDVGFITDANGAPSSKTYTLRIWLKTNLSSALAATVDGLNLAFKVDPAAFTFDDATNSNQKSSRFVATQPIIHSGGEAVAVDATQFDFSTSPISPQLVLTNVTSASAPPDNSTTPVVRARDLNGNTDKDYNASISVSGATAPVLPASFTMSNGIANLSGLQYQDSGNGQLTASSTTIAANQSIPPTNGNSLAVTVNYSNLSTIANVSAVTKVSSLGTSFEALQPYTFRVRDDGGAGGDGSPTRISQIKITKKGSASFIPDWRDILNVVVNGSSNNAGALISDGTGNYLNATVTVNQNDITISNMLSTNTVSDLGYIGDGATKQYQLYIWFKPAMTGGLQSTVDFMNFDFQVVPTDITLSPQSSLISAAQLNINSGLIDVDVAATKLVFTTDPPADVLVNANLSVSPVLAAQDNNGNLDLDYSPSSGIVVTNAGSLGMVNPPTSFSSGVLTFPSNFRYTQIGNGTPTVSSSTLAIGVGTAPTPVTSATTVTVRVGKANTITPGPLVEPLTISSLVDLTHTPAGLAVFDFNINDDPSGEDDGNSTQLTYLYITSGVGNTIPDWSQAIAAATLSDGTNTVNVTSIDPSNFFYFDLSSVTGQALGLITDNGFKTYTLKIWLKTALGGSLPTTIDGLNFAFDVQKANIGLTASSTDFSATPQSQNSGAGNNKVAVVASQLDVTSPVAASFVSINTNFTPVLQARDANANRDLDFTGASGTITAFTNASGATMANGPTVGTSQFTNGLLDFSVAFPTFQYTSGNNNDNVTLTIKAGTGTTCGTNAICNTIINPALTLKTNTITAGALVEPTIISSLATTAGGTNVFDFKINDDDNQASGTDAKPTKISKIVITQLGGGNDIADWRQIIASATLSSPGFTSAPGVINAATGADITFNAIPSSTAADLGFIGDNTSRTYTLNIVLLATLGGSLPATVDNLNLAFEVLAPNVTVTLPSSTFSTSENENSGATNNAVQVIATKLKWTTEPASSLLVNKDISLQLPVPVIEALDVNNNRDLNYVTSLNITDGGALPMSSVTLAESSVTTFSLPAAGTAPLTGGIYNFPNDFQFNTIGDGTMTAVPSAATTVVTTDPERISTPVTVRVGAAGTITAGALAEPATISSLVDLTHTPAGLKVFDFTINDDPGLAPNDPENDGNPTRISVVTITQGTGSANPVTDWSQVFAQVQLDDGTGNSGFGTITPTSLIFGSGSGIPNALPTDPGYIADNGSKTYTLTVWLKTNLSGASNYPITIDGMNFVYKVSDASITLNPLGSSFSITPQTQNSGSGNNKATVVATEIDFTTPSTATSASLSSDFAVVVEARDVNANRDLDFVGKITALSNNNAPPSTMINGPTIGTTPFIAGVYNFNSNFQFTSGVNSDQFKLSIDADNTGGTSGTNCGVNAICGVSPTITLQQSYESAVVGDPTYTFSPTINYIYHQESTLTSSSLEIARMLLVDGSRAGFTYGSATLTTNTDSDGNGNGDLDGAGTVLNSITIHVTNPANIQAIRLYSNGVPIAAQQNINFPLGTASHDFLFSGGPLLAVQDDSQGASSIAPISVMVSFWNTAANVTDGDAIQLSVIAASLGTGSGFYPSVTPGTYIAGVNNGLQAPAGVNIIDVVATKFDFTTQPVASSFEGINQPIAVRKVEAHDQGGLLDTGFNGTVLVSAPGANVSTSSLLFGGGKLDLTNLQYTSPGNGTLTIDYNSGAITSNLNNTVLGLPNAAVSCNHTDVINVTAAINVVGVQTAPNLKGGTSNNRIFGFTLNAAYQAGGEPNLKGFSITFKDKNNVPYAYKTVGTTILKGFKIYESTNNGAVVSSIAGIATISQTRSPAAAALGYPATSFDMLTVVFNPGSYRNLHNPAAPLSYYLDVDVDITTSLATPSIAPFLEDNGYADPNTYNNILLTQGSAVTPIVTGALRSFASTKPPALITSKPTPAIPASSIPYNGQLNVDPTLNTLTLQFDVPVTTFDGVVELYERYTNNKVATLQAQNGVYQWSTGQPISPTPYVANPLKFTIPLLPGSYGQPAGYTLVPDTVYYIKIAQGKFDPNDPTQRAGISDDGFNLFGGVSFNGTLYFKASSPNAPAMKLTDPTKYYFSETSTTINASFDQFGTAFFMIAASGSLPAPTNAQVDGSTSYVGAVARGSFPINQLNPNYQFGSVSGSIPPGNYDVWIYAENDAQPTPFKSSGPYGSAANGFVAGLAGPTFTITVLPASGAPTSPKDNINNPIPSYNICATSYTLLSDPIIISETSNNQFAAAGTSTFNILLPTGFQFDVTTTPIVQFNGADFHNSLLPGTVTTFINTTILQINYVNNSSRTGTITSNVISPFVVGVGTLFTTQVAVGDVIKNGAGVVIGTVQSITDDFNLVLTSNAAITVIGAYTGGSLDNIILSNISVIASAPDVTGYITRFAGNALTTIVPDLTQLAQITSTATQPINFTNSYSNVNQFDNPPISIVNTVTYIPDNYFDTVLGQSAVRLIPTPPRGDYGISVFSGLGLSNDVVTLNAVPVNTAFNISLTHTDANGCNSTKVEQYSVYDHQNAIPPLVSKVYGTKAAIVNTNFGFGSASNPILGTDSISFQGLAGYRLLNLYANIPTKATAGTQIMTFGSPWQTLVAQLPIPVKSFDNSNDVSNPFKTYRWNYDFILNASSAGLGLPDPYSFFISQPLPSGNTYYSGGSMGVVEFTGKYESTADPSVFIPVRQEIELFVPAVPLIEIGSANQSFTDATDGTLNHGKTPAQYISTFLYTNTNGYQGTPIFCKAGGSIILNGYPAASAGASRGTFAIYDFKSYDFAGYISRTGTISSQAVSPAVVGVGTSFSTELNVGASLSDGKGNVIGVVQSITDDLHLTLTSPAALVITNSSYAYVSLPNAPIAGTGFVDNQNGTATIDPSIIDNNNSDVLVTYTYQDNNSPAIGTGYLVIRVAPNPIADFTLTSAGPNASATNAYCTNNQIDFLANTINANYAYKWNFGDSNSPTNVLPLVPGTLGLSAPSHTFALSQIYNVSLDVISDLNCPSIPQALAPVGSRVIPVKVGDIPAVDFSFAGSCVGDPITFTDRSSTPSGANSTVAKFVWDFGDGSPTYTGYNTALTPSPPFNFLQSPDGRNLGPALANGAHQYSAPNSYLVTLTTITDLGCQNDSAKYVGQLPVVAPTQGSAYSEYFDGLHGQPLNGGYITLDIDPKHPVPIPVPGTFGGISSWNYDAAIGKWTTTSNYTVEKSALYTACLDLSTVPRPVISFNSNINLNSGDGVALQYSVDNLNIQDPAKGWEVLGTVSNGSSPGLFWYNTPAIPSSPGSGYTNSHNFSGLGWADSLGYTQPKHKLEDVGTNSRVILRFAFSSLTNGGLNKGVTIDSIRIGSRTRTILFENFTTTNAGSNAGLNGDLLSDANYITNFTASNVASTQLVNINYHVGFLGPDPFNLVSPADPSARALYYNVNKVPYAFLDGKHSQGSNGNDLFQSWGQGAYDLQTLNLANADFQDASNQLTTVTSNNTDGSLQVDVFVTPKKDLPASTMLQIGVLEESVPLGQVPASKVTTGEVQFNYVLKKLIPDAAGTKFPAGTFKTGVPVSLGSYKWVTDPAFGPGNTFSVVVFLQDEASRDVYQAELFTNITPPASTVTAIEPITADNIRVYPNPSDQEFTIELPSPAQQSMKLTVANQLGQFTDMGVISEGEQSKKISTQGLAEGVYILQLGSNGNALRTKVVVVHK